MSIDANKLLRISNDLGFKEISNRIEKIAERQNAQDCPLILPLVGEFSSGKTTLINALTDSKALETATKPTTATIFEIHFGSNSSKAVVTNQDGQTREVDNIAALKNSELGDVPVVTVFDTSTRVPANIVLVDTPGLSSPDPRHKQTLVDFLPQADAILLVTDINAQLTRSLTDFVKTMSLSNRRLYLVLTKTDTKSKLEVEASRKYLEDNLHVNKEDIVCVSAEKNDMGELLGLFETIQKDKAQILAKVNIQRLRKIASDISARIDELLKTPIDDRESEERIAKKKQELNKLRRTINNAIETSKDVIEAAQRNSSRKFEDAVSERLEKLTAEKSNDFDNEAMSAINNTASLVLNGYKGEVRQALHTQANKSFGTESGVDMSVLESIDISGLSIKGLSYNLDLNSLGHEYDGYISTGVKVAAAAAVVAATVATAGAAGAATAGTATTATVGTVTAATAGATEASAAAISTVASVADTATDVGSMVVAGKLMSRIKKAEQVAAKVGTKYEAIENAEGRISQKVNSKGIVTSMVGFFTDKAMGKPQRRRAIHDYMDNTLMPQFKAELENLTSSVVESVRQALNQGAENAVSEMTSALESLKQAQKSKEAEYENRISQLRDYKNELALM